MNDFDIVFTTSKIEELIKEGYEAITDIQKFLSDKISNRLLIKHTVNGKIFNGEFKEKLEKIQKIIISLEKHRTSKNNINLVELKFFIHLINLNQPAALEILDHIFKEKGYDNEDKELVSKYAAIYNELITKYENLIFQISLHNIEIRTLNNNHELDLLKLNVKNSYSTKEIEDMLVNLTT